MTLNGFQSSSFYTEPAVDGGLGKDSPGVIFEIRTRNGMNLTEGLGVFDDEGEWLIGHGRRFRVRAVLRDVKFKVGEFGDERTRPWVIQLDELP